MHDYHDVMEVHIAKPAMPLQSQSRPAPLDSTLNRRHGDASVMTQLHQDIRMHRFRNSATRCWDISTLYSATAGAGNNTQRTDVHPELNKCQDSIPYSSTVVDLCCSCYNSRIWCCWYQRCILGIAGVVHQDAEAWDDSLCKLRCSSIPCLAHLGKFRCWDWSPSLMVRRYRPAPSTANHKHSGSTSHKNG